MFTDEQKKGLMYALRNDSMFDEWNRDDKVCSYINGSTYLTKNDLKEFERITKIADYEIWFDRDKGLMEIRW